jgi:hypothetical protein
MLPRFSPTRLLAVMALALATAPGAKGQTWVPTANGTYSWNSGTNWTPSSVPNSSGATANLNIDTAGAQTINLNTAVAVGTLNFGDLSGNSGVMTLANGTGGSLTFDNGGTGAVLNRTTATTRDVISATMTLADDLTITNPAVTNRNAPFELSGKISGTKKLTIASGSGFVWLSNTANDFSGGV